MQKNVILVLILALAGCAGSPLEQDLEAEPLLVRLEREQVATSAPVEIGLTWREGQSLRTGTAGLVTRLSIESGDSVSSGVAFMSINGQEVVAISSDEPFYRSLSVGAKGADVAQLHAVLRSTGDMDGETSDDQVFGPLLAAAVTRFNARHFATKSALFDHTKIVWIESGQFLVESLLVRAGDELLVGGEIATSPPELRAVDFSIELQGTGAVIYDGARYQYREGVLSSEAVTAMGQQISDATVTSIAALVEVDLGQVMVVPVTAIQEGLDGPCVYSRGRSPESITVVGGEGGLVFVETNLADGDSVIANPRQLGLVNCTADGE